MILFELDDVPRKTYRVSLEGGTYHIRIRVNTLDDKLYMDLLDSSEEPLLLSHKITVDRFMLSQYRREGFPPGDFVFILPNAQRDPTEADLVNLLMYYVEEEEYGEVSEAL